MSEISDYFPIVGFRKFQDNGLQFTCWYTQCRSGNQRKRSKYIERTHNLRVFFQ